MDIQDTSGDELGTQKFIISIGNDNDETLPKTILL